MKKMRLILGTLLLTLTSMTVFAGNTSSQEPTAAAVFELAGTLNYESADILKQEFEKLSASEKVNLIKLAVNDANAAKEMGAADASVGLYILAVILPPLAVAIYTDFGTPTLWNILFTILGWLPGVIHAFYILSSY